MYNSLLLLHIPPSVQRTIRPQLLITPELALQARQALHRLTSLPPTKRARSRDLRTLCLITSTLLLNMCALSRHLSAHIILARRSCKTRCPAACAGLLCGFSESCEQGLGGLGGQVLEVVVVDLHHGCVDAGAEALDFGEGEHAVFGCFAGVDAEVLLNRLHDAVAAAELAGCLFGSSVSIMSLQNVANKDEQHTVVQHCT